ncbi:MAG: ABC transporter permease, partial [Anaerolineae bacterium]|nr:ABC transporter permease [Anaerolineae bacterium]
MSDMTHSTPAAATPHLVIKPSQGWVALHLGEVWAYRELLFFLTWRDIKVRYKQTLLGATWAIIQPFMTMVVFTLFFGGLAGIPSDGVPYYLFSFAGLVPWQFFAGGLSASANSLVGSAGILKKIYFPRLIIPIANVVGVHNLPIPGTDDVLFLELAKSHHPLLRVGAKHAAERAI